MNNFNKTFIILLFSSIFCSTNNSEKVLKEEIIYSYKINEKSEKLKSKTIHKYNIDQYKVESIEYNPNDEIENKISYKYDKKGNMIKESWTNPKTIFTYKYDSNNNIIERNCSTCWVSRTVHEYDESGKELIKTIDYDKNGNTDITNTRTYKYDRDDDNNVIKSYWYQGDEINEKSIPISYIDIQYDSKNNLKKQSIYVEGKLESIYNYKYDENNKKNEEIHYDYLNEKLYSTTKTIFEYKYY